jgi:hypothetical protein
MQTQAQSGGPTGALPEGVFRWRRVQNLHSARQLLLG